MEDLNASKRAHKLILNNRRTCNLTGVSDVLSFDENEIILETDQGMLMIKGNELHVNRLTLELTALLIRSSPVWDQKGNLCLADYLSRCI